MIPVTPYLGRQLKYTVCRINLIDRLFCHFNHVTLWRFSGCRLYTADTTDEETSQMCLALQSRTTIGGNNHGKQAVVFQ